MTTEEIGEWTAVGLFMTWLGGIPVAFGYLLAVVANPGLVLFGALAWPLTALGYFGYWLAT